MILARLHVVWWWRPSMWGVSFHRAPCCGWWLEFGPLEIGWAGR